MLDQFPVGRRAAGGEELFAVAHLEAALHPEPLAVGVGFQHQQRGVGGDDVILFGKGDDLVADRRRGALLQERVEVHAGPQPGDERIALLGVFERHLGGHLDRPSGERAAHDDLAHLVLALRQITAQENLLCAGRQVGERVGVNPDGANSPQLDFHIAQCRLRDLGQEFQGRHPRAVRGADLPHRAAAERRDGPQHRGLEAAAGGHGMEGRRRAFLAFRPAVQSGDEGRRIGVAGGRDAVAQVNHVGGRPALLPRRADGAIEVRVTQRAALGEELPGAFHIFLVGRSRRGEDPRAIHVAGGQIELVLGRQRSADRRDELGLRTPGGRIHRSRRVGQD